MVTARNTDIGALVNVGGAPGTELFVVSDVRRLRLYVQVPQNQVTAIQTGSQATFTVPEMPGQVFTAKVQSMAQAIQAGSGRPVLLKIKALGGILRCLVCAGMSKLTCA